MRTLLTRLLTEESASTAMEYALIASLVSVGAIAGFIAFASSASGVWEYAANAITSALQ